MWGKIRTNSDGEHPLLKRHSYKILTYFCNFEKQLFQVPLSDNFDLRMSKKF
jgi:hypothetical protein